MRANYKGRPFHTVRDYSNKAPVFSEEFLYERLGKEDARFVLDIAEEYERLIEIMGRNVIKVLLEQSK